MRRTRLLIGTLLGLAAVALAIVPSRVMPDLGAQLSNVGAYVVPATSCGVFVSGNSTGTQGYQVSGSSNTWVAQNQTSGAGTNTHSYVCDITPTGSRLGGGAVTAITKVTFFYGLVNALGTQSATLASGTFNSQTVFTKILMPTPATGETASTLAPARADTGTLTITPTTTNFNVTTSGAGQFFSATFTPAAAITVADLTKYFLNVTLQASAGTLLTTNTPGAIVYTR